MDKSDNDSKAQKIGNFSGRAKDYYDVDTFHRVGEEMKIRRMEWEALKYEGLGNIQKTFAGDSQNVEGGVKTLEALIQIEELMKEVTIKKFDHYKILMGGDGWYGSSDGEGPADGGASIVENGERLLKIPGRKIN